jgi:intergrase/recombinase
MEDAPRDLAELLQRVGIATEQQANEIRRLLPLMEDRQRRDIWGGLADGWKVG